MTHRPLIAALAFSLMGCPGPTPPVPTTCEADPNWINNPTMPSEVPEAETFCDFYQFSWQWFLAQASPSEAGDPVFMQNRVYSPTGGNDQCADPPITGIAGAVSQLIPRQGKPNNFEDAQADGNALYDQNGNVLYYNAFYSQEYCSSTAEGFAPGSMEAKISWMVLQEGAHHTYYTISAFLPGYDGEITLGLVGLHLAIWTPNHPEMIWATWEHKTNAPLCNGTSDTTGWSLASDAAATCLATTTNGTSGPPPASCNSFGFNVPATHPTGAVPITGDAINVCRQYAHGNQEGTAVNGNDNAANLAAITELNEALVGDEGLITKLPGDNPLSVWSNYEMGGAIWTKDGADSGPPPVPSTQAQGPGNADSPQRGSLELTNMTLETFQQGDTSAIPNCFGCHNYTAENPLGVSHIQSKLLPASAE
jgi:hypothetical protein